MLVSGFEKTSQSIIIDILTKDEFNQLRNDSKSYGEPNLLLIMTYLVEFDKVHYPLTIPLTSKPSDLESQEVENLRKELSELRYIQLEKDAMENRLEKMISEKDIQIYYLEKEKVDLQSELDKIKSQMDKIIEQLEAQALSNSGRVNKQSEEIKKQKEKLEIEVEKMKKENKIMKEESKKDKTRIIQLESELTALFDKSRVNRSKSINNSSNSSASLQKSYTKFRDSSEINQKICNLKSLLDRAKE